MIKKFCFAILILLPASLFSQTRYETYTWNTFPAETNNDTVKSTNGSVILLERDIKEVYLNKENLFEEILVRHRKIRVDTYSAINQNNKIFIPTSDAIDMIAIRARFISPTGKITELPKESIRQVENLENKGNYQSFVIEGAEVGGQIEYYFVLRKKFNPYGTIVKQDNQTRTNVDLIFTYPSKLEFIIKSYNGFPRFTKVTDSTGFTEQRARASYIPALEQEKYAFYEASLQKCEYTLAYNYYNSLVRAYSWSKAAARFYELFYDISKKESNAAKDWLQSMNPDLKNTETAIREIENHLKSEVAIVESSDKEMTLDLIFKAKQARKLDLVRLFVALYREAGIDFYLVATTDREKHPFDPDFNGWNFMDQFALFFPGSGNYIIPDDETQRYGLIPSEYQENYGMFFKPVSFQEKMNTLGYEIRFIPLKITSEVTDSLMVSIEVDPLKLSLKANTHRIFSKDVAVNFQAWWHLWDDSRKKEIIKNVFDMGDPNIRIISYNLQHNSPADIGVFPLTWNVLAVSDALMESAGEDILVKIGESIGAQSELYQASKRKLPVAISDLHSYYRRIELQIPAGYHTGDISSLNMNVSMMNNGKISCFFRSEAVMQGNMLIITSEEKYTETYYPKEKFEEFRSVINAAADFNKRTVLLKKN
ncbi:MAG: hypothetical protein NTU51_04370 [Bacteroidetes bacterium]|nr:hypothetical protein [Bacteroidota bacterium]